MTLLLSRGTLGRLNVYKEARPRGGQYWYAYHTTSHRTRKRYLGRTATMTFARLEEAVEALANQESFASSGRREVHRTRHRERALLSTKFASPCLPECLVERTQVFDALEQAHAHRLLLLSSSAGSGKTTTLSAWAKRLEASFLAATWLSLDEQDNDPTRFWSAVITARVRRPGFGEAALRMLHSPQPASFSILLTTILNELADLHEEVVLILDDYHVISEPVIHETLLFWLERLPDAIHLVLASRTDPPLALARLRTQGQVCELCDADLRFREAEVASFLNGAMRLALSEEVVRILEQQTEGWITGLQMAAGSVPAG